MLFSLVSTETISEGYAKGAVVVNFINHVLAFVVIMHIVVGCLEDVVAVCLHL